jgi:hypothetical protein
MRVKNMVTLTARLRLLPAASAMAFIFFRHWCVCSSMPPSTNFPVSGSSGSWPEIKSRFSATTPWE